MRHPVSPPEPRCSQDLSVRGSSSWCALLARDVLPRASAGLVDATIRGDVGHLDQISSWFGRPLWDMEPADADVYVGKVLRHSPSGIRGGPAAGVEHVLLVPGTAAQGRDP